MTSMINGVIDIPGVIHAERTPPGALLASGTISASETYDFEHVYGQFCPVQGFIDCPPEDVFRYLADGRSLEEWTYSTRDLKPTTTEGIWEGRDLLVPDTKLFVRTESCAESMTVDYHCAWDQGEDLWMIYLMRVVPARLVLGREGSVVTWVNCHHPHYDSNPYPELAPAGREAWVGDFWPMFPAGHELELANLTAILEYRHRNGLPIDGRGR
jgi:hypothetical protein